MSCNSFWGFINKVFEYLRTFNALIKIYTIVFIFKITFKSFNLKKHNYAFQIFPNIHLKMLFKINSNAEKINRGPPIQYPIKICINVQLYNSNLHNHKIIRFECFKQHQKQVKTSQATTSQNCVKMRLLSI